ncbi:MAG: hypothetical protein AB7S92_09890 [Parvibaculaceae bacterium]
MLPLIARRNLEAAFGLAVALGIAATRTEKLFAEMQASLPHEASAALSSTGHPRPEPFDPSRVPASGGMASRLLAGIAVKLA